jgi:hypothetical protein
LRRQGSSRLFMPCGFSQQPETCRPGESWSWILRDCELWRRPPRCGPLKWLLCPGACAAATFMFQPWPICRLSDKTSPTSRAARARRAGCCSHRDAARTSHPFIFNLRVRRSGQRGNLCQRGAFACTYIHTLKNGLPNSCATPPAPFPGDFVQHVAALPRGLPHSAQLLFSLFPPRRMQAGSRGGRGTGTQRPSPACQRADQPPQPSQPISAFSGKLT